MRIGEENNPAKENNQAVESFDLSGNMADKGHACDGEWCYEYTIFSCIMLFT